MNRIAYSFIVTPLIIGAVAASAFALFISYETLSLLLNIFILFAAVSYIGLLIGLPFVFLLKKYNRISLFSISLIGVFCALFLNSISTYFLYLTDLHRGGAGTVTSYIVSIIRISAVVGPLAGLIFWNFAFRSRGVSGGNKH